MSRWDETTPAQATPVAAGAPTWHPVGSIRGPAGPSWEVATYTMSGDLEPRVGSAPFPIAEAVTIESVTARCGAAPIGAPVVVDVRAGGTTIYGSQTDRPTIAAGALLASAGAPQTTALAAGSWLNVDVLTVGTALPGEDLTVVVRLRRVSA